MLAAGTRLGAYEILSPLGAGGMGEVYRARDGRLGRDVAVKVLPPDVAADADRLARFEHEARATAALNHPNILAVHDIGEHAGLPFIVSELLDGATLRAHLEGGALPVRKAVDYGIQIARGLAAAHDRTIVHRDLKPENIFITADEQVKILDFGLAKLTQGAPQAVGVSALPTTPPGDRAHAPDTTPGLVLGTVGYVAPEQVRGQPADHRADIFAFGAVLHEMLAGRRAFRGDTAIDAMTAILKDAPEELPLTERHIPSAVSRIVDRCLEKNPAPRFKSADDLAFALDAIPTTSSATLERPQPPAGHGRRLVSGSVALAAVPIAQRIRFNAPNGNAAFSVSPTGVLAYVERGGGDLSKLTWFDRTGRVIAEVPGEFDDRQVALAGDGERLAIDRNEGDGEPARDVWIVDTRRGTSTRVTSESSDDCCPIWSPDDRWILWSSSEPLGRHIYRRSADGVEAPELVLKSNENNYPKDWSRDGRYVVYESNRAGLRRDLLLLPMSGDRTPVAAVRTPAQESDGRFSPDGEWIAYTSDQSGRFEVYLQRLLPKPGQRLPASSGGGYQPRWSADRRELFYVTDDRVLMAVKVELAPSARLGVPTRLFELPISSPAIQPFTTRYAVAKDGRFIAHRQVERAAAAASLSVVVNWPSMLKAPQP